MRNIEWAPRQDWNESTAFPQAKPTETPKVEKKKKPKKKSKERLKGGR